jgi:hypothetical protein
VGEPKKKKKKEYSEMRGNSEKSGTSGKNRGKSGKNRGKSGKNQGKIGEKSRKIREKSRKIREIANFREIGENQGLSHLKSSPHS